MAMRFKDRVCVITASATGIGLGIARRMGKEGGKIVISSRNQSHIDEAVRDLRKEGIEAAGVVCHVSKDRKKLVKFAVDTYGGIDVLVNNAGASVAVGDCIETSEEAYDKMFDINVKSAYFLTQEALPWLKKSSSACVLFVSSVTGYTPEKMIGIYSITKTTLLGLVKALGTELIRHNIRVNGIAPGVIKTNFSRALWENEVGITNVLRRPGTVDECGALAAFMCSDDASFIVGETVVADGGTLARL